jgi:hypothetical protein
MPDPRPMAVTGDGALKPVSEFTADEKWWCDGEECGDPPGRPHVHCMMHRHPVDLLTGRSIDGGRTRAATTGREN